jgi:KDO2-lipid IV(A) lauroyltransferase
MPSSLSDAGPALDTGDDITARLAEVEAETASLLEVRDEPLVAALRRRGVQRAVPAAVGVAAAVAYARASWLARRPSRTRAVAWARAVLGPAAGEHDVRRLARRHLIEWTVGSELGWRPWLGRGMRIDGIEHLDAALRAGRGAIVGLPHFGPQLQLIYALCARGFKPYLVAPGGRRTGVLHGADGSWREFQRRHRERGGCRSIWSGGAFPVARHLLERGELVVVAWDIRGTRDAELLGRPIHVRAGAAQLAAVTGAPLLPGLVWRERAKPRARIGAPLEPAGDADSLLAALVADLDRELPRRLPQAHPLMAKLFARPA